VFPPVAFHDDAIGLEVVEASDWCVMRVAGVLFRPLEAVAKHLLGADMVIA
jgi:hypothetical protein